MNTAEELFYKTRSTSRSISTLLCVNTAEKLFYKTRSTSRGILTMLCVNTAEELFYKTRSTSRGIPTLLCVNTAEELFYKTRSTSRGIPTLLYVNTAEELFYKTRSTSRGIPTLFCVLILQRSPSIGAPVGVYIPCCVCKYCRGALLQDKEHQQGYTYPVVCVNTKEELFYKTRSTNRGIPTLLCVLILQRSPSTRQGAPTGVYLPYCVCQYCRGALLQDKEHQQGYTYPVVCVNTAEEPFYKTRSTNRGMPTLLCVNTAEELFYKTRSISGSISTMLCVLILLRSSSTRQGALVGVYLPCCVYYCRRAPQQY